VQAGKAELRGLARTYGDVQPGAPLALVGSAGFLELSVREGSAAALLGLSSGDAVRVRLSKPA
jgi:S-adenosylmethionine hydrolase